MRIPQRAMAYPLGSAIDGNVTVLDRYVWTKPQRYQQPSPAERFQALTTDFDRLNRVGTQHPGIYFFGVMRSSLLRRTRLQMSQMWSDISMLAELALEGPFIEVPEVLSLMRVEIPHATAMMLQGNLQGWQEILDPAFKLDCGKFRGRAGLPWEREI